MFDLNKIVTKAFDDPRQDLLRDVAAQLEDLRYFPPIRPSLPWQRLADLRIVDRLSHATCRTWSRRRRGSDPPNARGHRPS